MTTAPPPPPQPPARVEVIVPDELSAGVYSNAFATWYNQTDFTIDFSVHLPVEPRTDEDGNAFVHAPIQVVSRVKLPLALIFRLIQQLNSSYTNYEQQFGAVTPLGDMPIQPDVPPAN